MLTFSQEKSFDLIISFLFMNLTVLKLYHRFHCFFLNFYIWGSFKSKLAFYDIFSYMYNYNIEK